MKQLEKRREQREKAESDLKAAEEEGVVADVDKYSKRIVRVTKKHNEDCKRLLRLMGVPVIDVRSTTRKILDVCHYSKSFLTEVVGTAVFTHSCKAIIIFFLTA